ncbi:MAG: hypothetical protein ACKO7W_12850 [Elainella sp.]
MTQEPSQQPPKSPKASKPQRSRLQAVLQLLRQLGEIVLAFVPVVLDLLKQVVQLSLDLLKWLARQWQQFLPRLRSLLPSPWKTQLPDLVITLAALLLLVLLLWLPLTLLRPASAPAVPARLKQDGQPVRVEPARAEKLAALQAKFAEASSQYGDDLVQAIQADFEQNQLTINLGSAWPSLLPDQQLRLANDLYKQAQKLAFREFALADLQGKILARPAVVGTGMVILSNG